MTGRAPKPTTVFFDLDDTLFDHALTCRAALGELRRDEPGFRRLPLDRLWREYQAELHRTDQTLGYVGAPREAYDAARAERFRRLAERAGWTATEEEGWRLSRAYRRAYLRRRRPVPGAVPLVRWLARSLPVGVITNNQVAEQERKLRFLGIRGEIDPLVVSEAVGAEKPDRSIFEAALRAARVRPRDAVMVGDSWANDVLGARSAGIRPVWFNRFGAPRPARPAVDEIGSYRPLAGVARAVLRSGARRPTRPRGGATRVISKP